MTDENYRIFFQKLKYYSSPVCRLFVYSLLPNHFYLLVQIKEKSKIVQHFETLKKKKFLLLEHILSDFNMEQFSNFLNSYTKSFNKMYNRKVSLFMDYLRRTKVNMETDFANYIWYIHKNAVHHGLSKSIGNW